jgi:hypothetical protein
LPALPADEAAGAQSAKARPARADDGGRQRGHLQHPPAHPAGRDALRLHEHIGRCPTIPESSTARAERSRHLLPRIFPKNEIDLTESASQRLDGTLPLQTPQSDCGAKAKRFVEIP